jgi:hypothetical protein
MHDWHRSPGLGGDGLTWEASRLRPLRREEPARDGESPPILWELTELTTAAQLRAEGAALQHCVGSYADPCWRGRSRIWSLRARRADRLRHVLTIEIDPARRAVVQARGWRNRRASGAPLRLLQEWSARERLQVLTI